VDDDCAARKNDAPDQRANERAFAAAVRSDHRRQHRALALERDAGERFDSSTRILNRDVVEANHTSRRSFERKNGTPMSAVTAPNGNSAGGSRIRPRRSARTTRIAPTIALPTSSGRLRRTPPARTICGTTNPTNPTKPAAATVAAATSDDSRNTR